MSEVKRVEMLPPEVLNSPPAEAFCPHCRAELTTDLAGIWATATQYDFGLSTAYRRQAALERWKERWDCPACGGKIDATLTPTVTYHLTLTAPDPLERYTPNSRYWEAQKRGLPTSSNLKLTPESSHDR